MTFFGLELKPGKVHWIDATRERTIHLTQACLLKYPKRASTRVVLEICEPQTDTELRVALGVLSPNGLENIRMDMCLTSKMGLRIAGNGINGAVVHITGTEIRTESIDLDDEFEEDEFDEELVAALAAPDLDDDDDGDDDDEDRDMSDDLEITPEIEVVDQADIDREEALRRVQENAGDGKLVVKPKPGKRRDALPLIAHKSGLQYQDTLIGSGKRVVKGHNVAVSYVLRLENGDVIDKASRKRPFKFRLGVGECVKGFDTGVMGMREGGDRHLIVPPRLGYGSEPPPGIPRNATLYFDVSVVKAF